MDLKEKIKKLPSSPGVYLMKDSLNSVIYVGKSKNLKSRVASYFQNSKSHTPKVLKLVKNLRDFDYILTDTEFEAFMLECKLIKQMKPIYNRQMKNPKSYCYIRINEKHPDIQISSEYIKSDGNLYFGPYTSKNTVERGIQGIKECCKIFCSNNFQKPSCCLNYSLGLCLGMCLGSTEKKQYSAIFHKIINLLNGIDKSIIKEMEYNMNKASEKFNFESAAKYRDYISAVNYLLNKAQVSKFTKKNKNIALLEHLECNSVKFFLIKGNEIIFSKKYHLKNFGFEKLKSSLKSNILFHFDNKIPKKSIELHKEKMDEYQIIYSYLKSKSVNRTYVVISAKWLNTPNDTDIDNAINKLLFPIYH
ncbi:UvrB/UvrC motif-containing protein [Clostridium sp. WILCCON 0269]|uniref:UvrB/UvrC motif-containing protein n=1 Tax=Candidatus Clostridium eludens TaxID=3381663 RepID=A0ABW8SSE8_9CLOT